MKSVIYQVIVFKGLILHALKCIKFFSGRQVLSKFECLFKKVFFLAFYNEILHRDSVLYFLKHPFC